MPLRFTLRTLTPNVDKDQSPKIAPTLATAAQEGDMAPPPRRKPQPQALRASSNTAMRASSSSANEASGLSCSKCSESPRVQ